MISIKPVLLNASNSIRDNLEPDSNETEESDLHSEKDSQPELQPMKESRFQPNRFY
jgi:hypothetical protein